MTLRIIGDSPAGCEAGTDTSCGGAVFLSRPGVHERPNTSPAIRSPIASDAVAAGEGALTT
jgi:hypothetical protein